MLAIFKIRNLIAFNCKVPSGWGQTPTLCLICLLAIFGSKIGFAQDQMPSTPFEAIAWLEDSRNTVARDNEGDVTKIIIDYVPEIFVVGDLDIFPKLEVLEINYTGQFYDRHMSGIARLTSLKKFQVDYCEEISEASLSVLRYLPNLEEVVLNNCEAVYSLKALTDCRTLKKIDISSNDHLDFHVLKSLQLLPNLESLTLSENPSLEDKHLRWVAELPKLKELRLSNCEELTDEGLLHFANSKNLKILDLSYNPKIEGKTLDAINGESLEELYVNGCNLTDASLAKLAHLKSIKKIRVDDNLNVKGPGLAVFQHFRQLEEIWWNGLGVDNDLLQTLDGIETLKVVHLEYCNLISGQGLNAFANSHGLEELHLAGCRRVDGEDLAVICKFESLKLLDLSGTKIKPSGLERLVELKQLEKLNLSKCNWIDDEAIAFVAQLPGIQDLTLGRVPRLTDKSLTHLAQASKLRHLVIEDNKHITGAGFAAFPDDAPLKTVVLRRLNALSAKGVSELIRLQSLGDVTIEMKEISDAYLNALMGAPYLKTIQLDGDYDYTKFRQLINSLPNGDYEHY